jgi:hypothetical protein
LLFRRKCALRHRARKNQFGLRSMCLYRTEGNPSLSHSCLCVLYRNIQLDKVSLLSKLLDSKSRSRTSRRYPSCKIHRSNPLDIDWGIHQSSLHRKFLVHKRTVVQSCLDKCNRLHMESGRLKLEDNKFQLYSYGKVHHGHLVSSLPKLSFRHVGQGSFHRHLYRKHQWHFCRFQLGI